MPGTGHASGGGQMHKVTLGIYSIAEEISNFKVLAIKCDVSESSWQ